MKTASTWSSNGESECWCLIKAARFGLLFAELPLERVFSLEGMLWPYRTARFLSNWKGARPVGISVIIVSYVADTLLRSRLPLSTNQDPGMGLRRMVECFKEGRPEAFIGIPPAHVIRTFYPRFFKTVRVWITVGRRWFWRGFTLNQMRQVPWKPYLMAKTREHNTAAILFTTGSTGPAKGAVYTHGNFDAQLRHIKTHLGLSMDEIDLSTFPLFALFWPPLGITSVIPDMNPTKPARVNPKKIIEAILDQGVARGFDRGLGHGAEANELLSPEGECLHRVPPRGRRRTGTRGAPPLACTRRRWCRRCRPRAAARREGPR